MSILSIMGKQHFKSLSTILQGHNSLYFDVYNTVYKVVRGPETLHVDFMLTTLCK